MTRTSTSKTFSRLPDHIAIVPDGNGRWAEERGSSRLDGHRAGITNMIRLVQYLNEYPIKCLTIYGFSTENWTRPRQEIDGLFQLLEEFIDGNVTTLHEMGIKIRHCGRLYELPPSLQTAINNSLELTRNNSGMILNVAFNYGGRTEIVDATRNIIADGIRPEDVNEELFSGYLYTAGLPNIDLLIRTGDELRLSNFMIWQTAYSEYHFTRVLWPDFSKKDIDKALLSYSRRKRRFGGL